MENIEGQQESMEQRPVNFEIIQSLDDNSLTIKLSRNSEYGLQGKFGIEWQKALIANEKWFKVWDDAVQKTLDTYNEINISGTSDGKESAEWKVTGLTGYQIKGFESEIENLAKQTYESYK